MPNNSSALQTSAAINEAVQTLRDGGLVAFPTETVYGLGADARNASAIQKIFKAKGRPSNHPVIVHLAVPDKYDVAQIDWAALLSPWVRDLSEEALQIINALWPGPLTLVFFLSIIADIVTLSREIPASSAHHFSLVISGTRAGFGSMIVWPSDFANL